MPAKIISFIAPYKRKTESEIKISEIEKKALDKKMSYGQYVAMLEEEKKKGKNVLLCIFAVVGVIVVVAAICYGVYRYLVPDYLEDFDDDFDDDFFNDEDQV